MADIGLAKKIGLLETQVGDHLLLFDTSSEKVYALNVTAALIWRAITGPKLTIEDIGKAIGSWFIPGTVVGEEVQLETRLAAPITETLKLLQAEKVLVPLSAGNFSGPRQIQIDGQGHAPQPFLPPIVKVYTLDFLKQKHPGTFHSVMFSDMWAPSNG